MQRPRIAVVAKPERRIRRKGNPCRAGTQICSEHEFGIGNVGTINIAADRAEHATGPKRGLGRAV